MRVGLSGVLPVDGEVKVRSPCSLMGFDSAVLMVDRERFREMDGWNAAGLSGFSAVVALVTFLRFVALGVTLDVDVVFAPLRRVVTMLSASLAGPVSY